MATQQISEKRQAVNPTGSSRAFGSRAQRVLAVSEREGLRAGVEQSL